MASRKNNRRKQELAVIGLGRFGSSLALSLASIGYTVVGIDRQVELVQEYADRLAQTLTLDATDENALREVGLQHMDTVVVAIGTDFESSLLATVALKSLGVPRVICKAISDRQRAILLRVGADRVVLPEMEAGQRLAQDLAAPSIMSEIFLSSDYGIAEMRIPPSLSGKSLREADIRSRHGVTVLVVSRQEQMFVSPQADFTLAENDLLVLIGANADLLRFGEIS